MKPVIQCITNDVTKNDCANVVLAVGASPIMAHHTEEVEEVQAFSSALLLNLGTPEDFEAMKKALATAAETGHPVVLDPVGVSGISFRRRLAAELLSKGGITCIRGNYNEIRALAENRNTAAGLDAESAGNCGPNAESTGNSGQNAESAENSGPNAEVNACGSAESVKSLVSVMEDFARKTGIILVASGEKDIISDGEKTVFINAGSSMMTRITGTGCMASAVLAAVLAFEKNPGKRFNDVCGAMELYGKCGERAAQRTQAENAGTGTFRQYFMDEISLAEFV